MEFFGEIIFLQALPITSFVYIPRLFFSCLKSNCGARIDAGERFALEGTCTHCDQAAFLWEVLSTSDQDFDKKYIWLNDSKNHLRTEFNKTWPIFAALPQAFPLDLPEALYRFKFTGTVTTIFHGLIDLILSESLAPLVQEQSNICRMLLNFLIEFLKIKQKMNNLIFEKCIN